MASRIRSALLETSLPLCLCSEGRYLGNGPVELGLGAVEKVLEELAPVQQEVVLDGLESQEELSLSDFVTGCRSENVCAFISAEKI